jgi:hypothetical protein
MERLVDQSIRIGQLKRFPSERSQHAYQRGRSSETTLYNLVSRIEWALSHKIFALAAFLDVEGAFHNTAFQAMGKVCADHEVHFTTSRWFTAMLSSRMIRGEIRGVSSTMMVRRGCLQGCVLSPLLWNLVINSLLCRLNNDSLWGLKPKVVYWIYTSLVRPILTYAALLW